MIIKYYDHYMMIKLFKRLISNKPRSFVITGIILTDTFLFTTSFLLSFWICSIPLTFSLNLSMIFLSFLVIKPLLFYRFKVYHAWCRYASIQDFKQITYAHGLFSVLACADVFALRAHPFSSFRWKGACDPVHSAIDES